MTRQSLDQRLWSKVVKSPTGCWLWTGAVNNLGYGLIQRGKRSEGLVLVHRLVAGDPPGLCVLHKCDNPRCVNPAHLFLGTKRDNTRDAMAKKRLRHNGRFVGRRVAD